MSTTMTEGAVDVLEALDFEPPCDAKVPKGCSAAATWTLRFDPAPCDHNAAPWLCCDEHRKIMDLVLAGGAWCAYCHAVIPWASVRWQLLR